MKQAQNNHKVLRLRSHVGVQVDAIVYNTIDSEKNKAEMCLSSHGVLVEMVNGKKEPTLVLVPYGNIHSIMLDNPITAIPSKPDAKK
jgi:hypothetical protein